LKINKPGFLRVENNELILLESASEEVENI